MDWAQQQCGKINELIGGVVNCYDRVTISIVAGENIDAAVIRKQSNIY